MVDIDPSRTLLIVVGADLKSEVADRPLGYRLQKSIVDWLLQRTHYEGVPAQEESSPVPVVCSDIWYLNNDELHEQPLISIGGPGVNAVASYLQDRLPTALHIEQKLVIQLDVELTDLRASVWGMNHPQTDAAVELFERRYLPSFMQAVTGYV